MRPGQWLLVAVSALLQLGRLCVIARLGGCWTTRIIVPCGQRLTRAGPYRFCRHPNYLIVMAEIALLPLAFGAVAVAAIFSAANLVLLLRRIRIEEAALAPSLGRAAITFAKTSPDCRAFG